MACISRSAYVSPPIRARVSRALSVMPFSACQRGLSGIKKTSSRKAIEGTAAAQNIQRQAICPFHDAAMSAAEKSAGMGSAICQFTIWAARMPTTIVIWFSETSLPRISEGATSAIYIGERPEAMPMPMPPKKRATRN